MAEVNATPGNDIPPNQTIYINNLNEKIKLDGILISSLCIRYCVSSSTIVDFSVFVCIAVALWIGDDRKVVLLELKKSLHAVFSQFGKILEVLAFKTLKHKGQAWVVFEDVSSASNAIKQLQGFPFYGKEMRIRYAKTKSDIIAKADGTFVPREKRKKHDDRGRKKKEQHDANQAAIGLNPAYAGPYGATPPLSQMPYMAGVKAVPEAPAPPNNILFIQNLPHNTTPMMLQMLFCQYPGLKEVRTVEAKPGIAFVEYENEMQSTVAMQGLQGFKINPENPMLITYAKK